jgi:hypothetical protein
MRRTLICTLPMLLVLGAVLAGCSDSPNDRAATAPETAGLRTADPDADWQARIAAHVRKHRDLAAGFEERRHLHHSRPSAGDPLPIPGGLAEGVHVWLPGPIELGFQGTDVEPSTITDYRGFSAIGYLAGTVTGSDGVLYDALHDMRLYQGFYRDEDGRLGFGTFAFV